MFFGSICFSRIFCSVSRGMELVAIRMSQTCVMPSTLVHWGVSSVMPWTMSIGPFAGHHREDAAAEFVERLNANRLANHFDRRAAAGHALVNGKLLIDLPVVLLANLADQPLGEKRAAQIVVQEKDVLDRAAVGFGWNGRLAESADFAEFSVQYAAVFQHVLLTLGRPDQDAGASRRTRPPSARRRDIFDSGVA